MTTLTINSLASGVWAAREGETVELLSITANGRAAEVRWPGATRPVFLPARWLDGLAPEPERCPTCGREVEG